MKIAKIHVYFDKESGYLEIRFGEPTESRYEKVGPDTYVRIDEETGEKRGYAIFNAQKGTDLVEFDIPIEVIKKLRHVKSA